MTSDPLNLFRVLDAVDFSAWRTTTGIAKALDVHRVTVICSLMALESAGEIERRVGRTPKGRRVHCWRRITPLVNWAGAGGEA
jgi:predicted transcriptional regulator